MKYDLPVAPNETLLTPCLDLLKRVFASSGAHIPNSESSRNHPGKWNCV
jgi:hypothetical protein